MSEIKSKSIFDLLNDLTFNKTSWKDQVDSDRKKFQPYMVNRWLSMHPDYLEIVSECQNITNNLQSREFYNFYLDLLPKKKFFTKYVSNKSDKEKKYDKLVSFLKDRLQCSEKEMEEHLETLFELPGGISIIRDQLKKYGFDDKQIKKEFGL